MSKFKDNLIFWTAHAKLNKRLSSIIKNLEKYLDKHSKKQQEELANKLSAEYYERKKDWRKKAPKWLISTNLDMSDWIYSS